MTTKSKIKKAKTSNRLVNLAKARSPFKGALALAVVAIMVAVGYVAVKSFAASQVFVVTNGPKKMAPYGRAYLLHGDPAGITSADIWRIDPGGDVSTNFNLSLNSAAYARICAYVRFANGTKGNTLLLKSDFFGPLYHAMDGSLSYKKVCSPDQRFTGWLGVPRHINNDPLKVMLANYGPGVLLVQYMTFEYKYTWP